LILDHLEVQYFLDFLVVLLALVLQSLEAQLVLGLLVRLEPPLTLVRQFLEAQLVPDPPVNQYLPVRLEVRLVPDRPLQEVQKVQLDQVLLVALSVLDPLLFLLLQKAPVLLAPPFHLGDQLVPDNPVDQLSQNYLLLSR
jgi:hypothetical protein